MLVGVVALVVASLAMLPGVAFWDTGELQTVGPLMGTAHPTGFPTYVLLGWFASVVLQPLGEPAFRMNVLAALSVAVAAGVTVDLVRGLTGWLVLGVAAGIGLVLTPIVWAIATHAETHALHLAFVAILLWLLVAWDDRVRPSGASTRSGDRFLVAAAVVFGLAVGNHSLTLLLAIPVGLYVLAVDPEIWRRPRLVWSCVGALAVTLIVVYLELPLRAGPFRAPLVYGSPDTLEGFVSIVFAEQFRGSLADPFGDLPRKLADLIDRTAAQFWIFAPLVPVAFVATAVRMPRYALLTGSAVAITAFFAASYENADIGRYYLGPALMAWTWLAILAAAAIRGLVASGGLGRGPELTGVGAPQAGLTALLIAFGLVVPSVFAIPSRVEGARAVREIDARDWTDHVLDAMAPDAVIVSWWSYSTPLWYAQLVQGRRQDLTIVDDRSRLDERLGSMTDVIDANLGTRPVYVIRIDPKEIDLLTARYELEFIDGVDASKLTRVIGRR
ncbi:MAG: DUF2723 domain-containing protein [Chloroflexi bacterium]|nr:DUF2723 domain-containing protein [Chloroflexota bacterium]